MSYLLEALGRGWPERLSDAFRKRLGRCCVPSSAELRQALRDDPDRNDLRVHLGIRYLVERDPVRARPVLERAVQADEADPLAQIALACALDELGHGDQAICRLRAAARLDPGDASIWFAMGVCHERQANVDDAVDCYQRCLTLDPGARNAHERLAAIFLRLDRPEDAIEHLSLIHI